MTEPVGMFIEKGEKTMRLNNSFFYTMREDAKDEDSRSGNLLVRAGMIKKTSSGIYMILSLIHISEPTRH